MSTQNESDFPTKKQLNDNLCIVKECIMKKEFPTSTFDSLLHNNNTIGMWIGNIMCFNYVIAAIMLLLPKNIEEYTDSYIIEKVHIVIQKTCSKFKVHLFENGIKGPPFELGEFNPPNPDSGQQTFPMNTLLYTDNVLTLKEALVKYYPDSFKDRRFKLSFMEISNASKTVLDFRINISQKTLFLAGKSILLVSYE